LVIRVCLVYLPVSRPVTPRVLPSFPTRRSSDLSLVPSLVEHADTVVDLSAVEQPAGVPGLASDMQEELRARTELVRLCADLGRRDRKSTRLNSSHVKSSYAVFCLQKKNKTQEHT